MPDHYEEHLAPPCRCGHPKAQVDGDAGGHFRGTGECMASSPTETWACGCHAYEPAVYELADFEPSDGHLHRCERRRLVVDVAHGDLAGAASGTWFGDCSCAALARDVAEDLARELARIRWWLGRRHEMNDGGHHRTLLEGYDRLNPEWLDHQLVGQHPAGTDAPPVLRPAPPVPANTPGGVTVLGPGGGPDVEEGAREIIEAMPPVRPRSTPTL